MDVRKKKFLNDVKVKLKSMGMPDDKISQVINEVEVRYDIEEERGKSHGDIIRSQFAGAREVADKYGKIFGYSGNSVSSKVGKNIYKNITDGINYSKSLNRKKIKTVNSEKVQKDKNEKKSGSTLSSKIDKIIMDFIEGLIED